METNSGTPYDFIVLEGIDGSGKSTAMNAIKQEFPNWKYYTDPTSTEYGQAIKDVINSYGDRLDDKTKFVLYASARKQLMDKIRTDLCYTNVVCDRSFLSNIVYAMKPTELDNGNITYMSDHDILLIDLEDEFGDTLLPDMVFYLKPDYDEIIKRNRKRQDKDMFDEHDKSYWQKINRNYMVLLGELETRYEPDFQYGVYDNASQIVEDLLA